MFLLYDIGRALLLWKGWSIFTAIIRILASGSIVVVGTSTILYSQLQVRDPVEWRAGVFGGYGLNIHAGVFDSLTRQVRPIPYTENTGKFKGGIGQGWTLGGLFEKPVSHHISLAARLSWSTLDATMSILEPAFFLRDSSGFFVPANVDI
ncbi:MAG: hypothetical protein RML40_12265, partial [Bacteroidota bacterium]|nr:hypothetical protein [Bacteroidota bacterium]